MLKRRLRRPQVRFRVRLHEQEGASGGPQRVGTTSMKMTKNPNEGLRRILAERKREIVKEIQDKFRDVRAQAEWKETSEVDAGGIFEADTQQDIEFALIQMKAETLDQINQALSRLDEGAYGYCLECGEEIPDEFLGRHIAGQTNVDVILWTGHCEVHERFSAADLRLYREQYQDIQVLAHPECPPDVLAEADFVGSTSGMIRYVGQRRPTRVVMITECSMSDNVAVDFPRITLPKILRALETLQYPVVIEPAVAEKARRAVERMLHVAERPAQ